MDYFVEIKVLPDSEFKETTLISAVYSKLHRALVTLGNGAVGVSFPRAGNIPGDLIRLHGGLVLLETLMQSNWLKGLRDYTSVSPVQPVPETGKYLLVQRVQPKMTAARLRRAVRRGSMTEEEANNLLAKRKDLKQPFFQLQSQSSGQKFPLFIEQKEVAVANGGVFNSYGLSSVTTVPYF
ncbi:type I-F CRISPR-associated endoribonuclease Cas6/Csy4 [uncultured Desulfuromonas sp.]|uniref:type I-F CRISPR-associated endoribonuclease Cas6/Csy4 n=1 Tax=uncultured Desulfuromonas sp. TaxID=181013 RepID=UPI002AAB0ABA|nr:type I-F CRISPR-associated endoribonuclease Cas6/Csy4 [uncultured Desulfuromonas sp.]